MEQYLQIISSQPAVSWAGGVWHSHSHSSGTIVWASVENAWRHIIGSPEQNVGVVSGWLGPEGISVGVREGLQRGVDVILLPDCSVSWNMTSVTCKVRERYTVLHNITDYTAIQSNMPRSVDIYSSFISGFFWRKSDCWKENLDILEEYEFGNTLNSC